ARRDQRGELGAPRTGSLELALAERPGLAADDEPLAHRDRAVARLLEAVLDGSGRAARRPADPGLERRAGAVVVRQALQPAAEAGMGEIRRRCGRRRSRDRPPARTR